MPTRILLADDHQILRQSLKALLEREGFQVVAEASNGQEAVQASAKVNADVAVMDISMPILNGIDATKELLRVAPRMKVVLLTKHDEDQYVMEALRAGARGFVLKTQAATDLVHAIQQVCRGAAYLSPSVSRTVVDAVLAKTDLPPEPLTPRERQVLQMISEGKSSKEIANFLNLSVKTVESHRTRLMQKLDIHEVASLVRYAIRRGLIEA